MKKLKTLAILLLILAALQMIARGQTYKVQIPNTDKAWVFQSLDDNKKTFTLVKDTLYIHKKIDEPIKEQLFLHRYLRWKGKVYRYAHAYYDYAYFYGNRKGKEIY